MKFRFFLFLFGLTICYEAIGQPAAGQNSSNQTSSGSTQPSSVKEVLFDFANNKVFWYGQQNGMPCIEGFNLKIVNTPSLTPNSQFIVNIYESVGGDKKKISKRNLSSLTLFSVERKIAKLNPVNKGSLRANSTYTLNVIDGKTITDIPIAGLPYKRYFYIEVTLIQGAVIPPIASITTTIAPIPASTNSVITTTTNTSIINASDVRISTTIITSTITPSISAVNTTSTITTNTVTTISTNSTTVLPKSLVYSTASKKEFVYFELYAAAGMVGFFDDKVKNLDGNLAVATGVKFRAWPTSNNGNYYNQFALYPFRSRFSLVVAAVLNNLSYKSTNINPLAIGIKPLVGIDIEIAKVFGVTAGAVFGKQDRESALNATPNIVVGVMMGLSVSFEVFNLFKSSIPGLNLPNVQPPTN